MKSILLLLLSGMLLPSGSFAQRGPCGDGAPQSIFQPPWPEPEPLPLAPPDTPPRSVIHVYNWPAASPSAAAFVIVTRDGQVRRAAAVWRTGAVLHFSGLDRREGSVKLDFIDSEATHRLNAAAGLAWPLALR